MTDLEELRRRSPLRVLDRSIDGGLGPGNLGVVWGAPGVGKTAFLVGVALDELARDRQVLHVAFDQTPDRVQTYYDEIFRELGKSQGLARTAELWQRIEQGLRIQSYTRNTFSLQALQRTVALLEEQPGVQPDLLLLDGLDWRATTEGTVQALKVLARSLGAKLWMSTDLLPDLLSTQGTLIDVLLQLKADAGTVHLRLLKEHEAPFPKPLLLDLNPATLLLTRT